jgi:hypothetical protein
MAWWPLQKIGDIQAFTVTCIREHIALISNPKSKAKSVIISEEGYQKAEELFWKYFSKG